MELIREPFRTRRLTAEAYTTQEETAEAVVADANPDAARIADAVASVTIRDRLPREGAAEIRGTVRVCALCIEEGTERLMRVEVPLSFVHKVELPGLSADAELMCDATLTGVEARLLNPRKLSVRAGLRFHTRAYTDAEELLTSGVRDDGTVQERRLSFPVRAAALTGTKSFTVIEELPLEDADIAETLAKTAEAAPESAVCGEGRVTIRGNAAVRVLYNDSAGLVRAYRAQIPFEQAAEFPGAGEDMRAEVTLSLKSAEIELADDTAGQKVLSVTLGVCAETVLYETRTVTLLADAYSTAYETETAVSPFVYETPEEPWTESVTVEEKAETVCPVGRVVDWQLSVPGGAETLPDGVQVTVLFRALYAGDDGLVYGLSRRIPVTVPAPPGRAQELAATITDASVTGADALTVRFTLHASGAGGGEAQTDMLSSIEAGEALAGDPDTALILRFAADESLWTLAKAYHAAPEAIRALNDLPEDAESPGPGAVLIPAVQ